MSPLRSGLNLYYRVSRWLALAIPVLDIGLRVFLANVFFKSGLTKIQTWDSTLYLFREEYKVPLLPPDFAAYLGTGAEMAFPILLVLGLFGRFAALGLSVLNAVAVYSYYDSLSDAGRFQHLYWGILLAVLLVHGLSRWSADEWLERRYR